MRRIPRAPRRRTVLRWAAFLLVAVAVVATVVVVTRSSPTGQNVRTEDAMITVTDGPPGKRAPVAIDTTLYLPDRTPAPAVMIAHGFGGSKRSVDADARDFAARGFVVLAWTARGFGRSGGTIELNSPDYEVADAQQLITWLAKRPEVRLNGPGDPVVGVTGGSYGGALSLMLAGSDKRIDALAPVITYNDLSQALLPNTGSTAALSPTTPAAGPFGADGVFKRSWAGIFFASGMGGGGDAGSSGPEAPEPGSVDDSSASAGGDTSGGDTGAAAPSSGSGDAGGGGAPGGGQASGPCGRFGLDVCAAYAEVATTGVPSAKTVQLLKSVSPVSVTGRITQPTLLVQGEQDTLFGLDQADANARQIAAAGGKVRVVWYAGGHDGGRPGPQLRDEMMTWFAYQLDHQGTDPGTGFEYAVQGALRAQGTPSVRIVQAPAYPGLTGASTQREPMTISGPGQTVINPPGGNPGSVSSLPGLSSVLAGTGTSSRLSGRTSVDLPGQSASFSGPTLDRQLLIAGSATVRLDVSVVRGLPQPKSGAVLFAKLYDVGPDGTQILPGSGVSPVRLPVLPANGDSVRVTVALPGIVRPIESGHHLSLVVTTTDQAYATPPEPAAYRVAVADNTIAVPVVPGTNVGGPAPVGPVIGIVVVLGIAALLVVGVALRRRRSGRADPALADVPLVIDGLTKRYPGGLVAVDDLSFRVTRGQVLGLLGPNGAGKTTALRMLMGLIRPTGGTIRVFGHEVTPGAPVLSRIGSFVEGAGFLPHLSGADNLRLYWAATGRPEARAHVHEALEIAGLGNAIDRKVRTYSQGMRQRLAIAQAMLGLPDLLVLDEPTNGLDPPQIHQMRSVLRAYAATGRTVLVSSHLLAEVEQTCDHVVVMHRGRLVAAGPVDEIVAGGGEATFRVDNPDVAADVLRGISGVTGVAVDGSAVHAELDGTPRSVAIGVLVSAGVAVEQAGPRRRLEDVFLQLVGDDS